MPDTRRGWGDFPHDPDASNAAGECDRGTVKRSLRAASLLSRLSVAGVDTVFGMVGHSNLGLADALRRAEEDGRLSYFGIRHEGVGAFAASAYAKLTGRPAACFSIAGPGATNLLTGLWDAKVDRVPILALTGQVQTRSLGRVRSKSYRRLRRSQR